MGDTSDTLRPVVTFASARPAVRDWRRTGDGLEPEVLFTLEEEAEQEQGQDPGIMGDGSTITVADNCGWLRDRLSRVYIRCGVGSVKICV